MIARHISARPRLAADVNDIAAPPAMLATIRAALRTLPTPITVTALAARLGFGDLGRLAAALDAMENTGAIARAPSGAVVSTRLAAPAHPPEQLT